MTDILDILADTHKQATTERSHYYTGKVIAAAATEIAILRNSLQEIARGKADRNPLPGARAQYIARDTLDALKLDWSAK